MLSTITVRIKLSDFINTDREAQVMNMINKTHNDLRSVILLHLWYENDELSASDIRKFLEKWQNKMFFKTKIRHDSKLNFDEFVFFDIVPSKISQGERYRFKYEYQDANNIMSGLNQLYDCVKFITSDKPNKRQKRNDYED